MTNENKTEDDQTLIKNHPVYWFEDGSLVIDVEVQRFKVHRTLLSRHSRFFSKPTKPISVDENGPRSENTVLGNRNQVLEPLRQIKAKDVEVLLKHLYHDSPFNEKSPEDHVMSMLRITSPKQLDFPELHERARKIFQDIFPRDPAAFTHGHPLHEALPLATDFNLHSVRKSILYSLVTTTDFEITETLGDSTLDPQKNPVSGQPHIEISESQASSFQIHPDLCGPTPIVDAELTGICDSNGVDSARKEPGRGLVLDAEDAKICMTLMTRLIEHFTPTLFTPPPTSHMECTDALAGVWMTLVIQPAISNDGVYKPLETLESMKGLDLEKEGLCRSCTEDKRREWTDEQCSIWQMMDDWLELPDHQVPVAS